jgi:hypothetical protein
VLPRSPLPEPPATSSTSSAAATAAAVAAARSRVQEMEARYDDEPVTLTDPLPATEPGEALGEIGDIEWVDDGPAPPPLVEGPSPEELAEEEIAGRAKVVERPRTARPRRAVADEGRDVLPPTIAAPAVPLSVRLRRNRNSLIFVAVALMVVGTVAFRTWRSRRADLPRIAELGKVEGLAALDEGRFDRAHQLLSQAKQAVISLGDAYEGAEAIKQGADEAAIIAQLVPASLEDLLDEASRADPKDWARTFSANYQGRSLIVDARVSAVPDGLGNGRYELDYRIFREGEGGQPRSMGRIDTTGFKKIDQIKPRVGDRLILGARLGSFKFDAGRDEWLVGLEPESGVIMTHAKALEALGMPVDGESAGEGSQ